MEFGGPSQTQMSSILTIAVRMRIVGIENICWLDFLWFEQLDCLVLHPDVWHPARVVCSAFCHQPHHHRDGWQRAAFFPSPWRGPFSFLSQRMHTGYRPQNILQVAHWAVLHTPIFPSVLVVVSYNREHWRLHIKNEVLGYLSFFPIYKFTSRRKGRRFGDFLRF